MHRYNLRSMGTHELLKARFAMVRQDLGQVLDRLVDADLTWAPREGMRTISGQLLEIANKEKEATKWLQTGTWPDEDPDAFDESTATLEEIKAVLAALRQQTYAYIDSMSETELERTVRLEEPWWEALRLTDCPLSEILRNIAMHEWYHTGQLVAYLWQKGDDPETW